MFTVFGKLLPQMAMRPVGSQVGEEAGLSVEQQLPSLLPVGLFISLLFGGKTGFHWEVSELQKRKG